MTSFTISYQLYPPAETEKRIQLSPTATHTFHLKPLAECKGQKEYYERLSSAIQGAKERVGLELTAWKEAVGNSEQAKGTARIEMDEDSQGALSQDEE